MGDFTMRTEDKLYWKISEFAEAQGADPQEAAYAMMVAAASLVPYRMKKETLSLFAAILDQMEECQKEVEEDDK
jgi:hypothetical protein